MSEFDLLISEQLEDPGFRKEWNDIQPEMDIIRAMIIYGFHRTRYRKICKPNRDEYRKVRTYVCE